MNPNLRLAALAALAISLPLAQGDTFISTASEQDFYVSGAPNFDQRRHATEVTIQNQQYPLLGLSNDGAEYCGPMAAIEWCDFLANRGYPGLTPGPGDLSGSWTDGVIGLGEYNLVDLSCAIMGAKCQTEPIKDGTSLGGMVSGVQAFLDANEYGDFNVVAVGPDSSGIVRMRQLLSASLDGNLIIPLGGWYSTATYNNSTVYYRTGGHFVALTSALWQSSNSDQVAFQIANPWTYDDLTVQSPYAYQSFTAQASSIEFTQVDSNNMPVPNTQNTMTADFMDQNNGWILDGAVEIQPLKGYTVHKNLIFQLMPQQFMNIRERGLAFATYDGSSVVSFSRDPITDNLYYTTALNPYAIVCVNPTSRETNVQQTRGPLRGMTFGFEREPYVLTGDSTISMLGTNSDANPFSFTADFPIDTFSFDPGHNSLVAVSARSHKIVYLDKFLQSVKIMRLPVTPSGDGALTVQVGPNGKTMLFRSGSSKLLEVWRHKKGEDDDDSDGDDQGLRWRQIELPKAVRGATTFSVDDWGRTYFSVGGQIVALNKRGHVIQTPFSGLMGGESLTLTRSGSNFDPALHTGPGWVNNVPDGAFRGSQGN